MSSEVISARARQGAVIVVKFFRFQCTQRDVRLGWTWPGHMAWASSTQARAQIGTSPPWLKLKQIKTLRDNLPWVPPKRCYRSMWAVFVCKWFRWRMISLWCRLLQWSWGSQSICTNCSGAEVWIKDMFYSLQLTILNSQQPCNNLPTSAFYLMFAMCVTISLCTAMLDCLFHGLVLLFSFFCVSCSSVQSFVDCCYNRRIKSDCRFSIRCGAS